MPVYNDAVRLALCLAALEAQTYPRDRFEVIVIDNGSTDAIGETVARFPDVIALCEPTPGAFAARNCGIARACGEIIAFTDADCIPQPDWMQAGVRALQENAGCGFAGGAIEVFAADPQRPTAVELYDRVLGMPQEEFVFREGYAATANMFTTRAVMETAGVFAPLRAGEDAEWGRRVGASGLRAVYAPEVVIRHPARRTLGELRKRTRRYTGGRFELWRRRGRLLTPMALVESLAPPLWRLRGILTDRRLSGPAERARLLPVLAADWSERLIETARLLQDSRREPTR